MFITLYGGVPVAWELGVERQEGCLFLGLNYTRGWAWWDGKCLPIKATGHEFESGNQSLQNKLGLRLPTNYLS